MIFKFSSLLVSDYNRLCTLLHSKKLSVFLCPQKSARKLHNIFLNKHKFLSSWTGVFKMSANASSNSTSVFTGKEDRFKGIIVRSELEPCDAEEFEEKLKSSLTNWKNNKIRGIWFRVHLNQCKWVPILIQNGFKYHHAKEDFVMLYFWLPSNESNNIPNFSHTMVGVGAVVVNDQDEVLVVRERNTYKLSMWKLPGGYVEPGENLVDAAIREVAEETGVKAQFQSVLSIRHAHQGMFGCSDIYFVVSLRALSTTITKCEREIAECQWMDMEEYLNHSNVHELNKLNVQKLLHHRKLNIKIDCHHGVYQLLDIPYTIYSIVNDDEADLKDNKPKDTPFPFLIGESSKSGL